MQRLGLDNAGDNNQPSNSGPGIEFGVRRYRQSPQPGLSSRGLHGPSKGDRRSGPLAGENSRWRGSTVISCRCDNLSVEAGPDVVSSHRKEWIDFILAIIVMWLLTMVAIHELELPMADQWRLNLAGASY